MLIDWLKTPACKICTNQRNAKRSAIIRLSSTGKAGVELKINWQCQPQNGLIHLLDKSKGAALFAFLPSSLPSVILIFLMQSSKSNSSATSSMESSWITTAPISRLPGPHWKDTREWRLKAQAVMSDLQSTLILSPLAVWPWAHPLWASVSFSEKNGTKRVTVRIKWDKCLQQDNYWTRNLNRYFEYQHMENGTYEPTCRAGREMQLKRMHLWTQREERLGQIERVALTYVYYHRIDIK